MRSRVPCRGQVQPGPRRASIRRRPEALHVHAAGNERHPLRFHGREQACHLAAGILAQDMHPVGAAQHLALPGPQPAAQQARIGAVRPSQRPPQRLGPQLGAHLLVPGPIEGANLWDAPPASRSWRPQAHQRQVEVQQVVTVPSQLLTECPTAARPGAGVGAQAAAQGNAADGYPLDLVPEGQARVALEGQDRHPVSPRQQPPARLGHHAHAAARVGQVVVGGQQQSHGAASWAWNRSWIRPRLSSRATKNQK